MAVWGWPTPVITDSGLRHSGGAGNATGWKIEKALFLFVTAIHRRGTGRGTKARCGSSDVSSKSHLAPNCHPGTNGW